MINEVNNSTNFKATLKPTFIVPKNKRFDSICSKFSQETGQFSDNIFDLYISEVKNKAGETPKLAFRLNLNDIIRVDNLNNVFITDSLDKHLTTMTDSQIAKKFANIFKVLHYKYLLTNKLPNIKSEIEYLTHILDELKPKIKTQKEKQLSKQLEETITALQEKCKEINEVAKDNIKKSIKENDELKEFTKELL